MSWLTRLRRADFLRQATIDRFHRLWYDAPDTWRKNQFLGHPVQQLPLDLWLYQELIYQERPAFFVQTGVASGGSALFFAHLFDIMGMGPEALVIGIDLALTPDARRIVHPRVRLIEGNSTAPETIAKVKACCPSGAGMVSLDSDHSRAHVLAELEIYSAFVGPGLHLVVEDTNVNGHPVDPLFGPGPMEAVDEFLRRHSSFVRDDAIWRRNLFSFHQYGWLRRVR